jgi:hypothetical protein
MAGSQRLDFFSNAAAGNSTAAYWQGGKLAFIAEATFGAGTVKMQFMSPHGTWIDVPSGSLSANGMLILELPQGQVRAVGTTASAIYACAVSIQTSTKH